MFNEIHTGTVLPLDKQNVDTDQIIPKQFLMSIERTGYAKSMFYDWRFLDNGSENPDFVLNSSLYKGATILLTRDNFGCGSSREHAVWALEEYGLTIMLSTMFADIFHNNSVNNGLLPIQLSHEEIDKLFSIVKENPATILAVDLDKQTISAKDADYQIHFNIKADDKSNILNNADLITTANKYRTEIDDFENKLKTLNPWLWGDHSL